MFLIFLNDPVLRLHPPSLTPDEQQAFIAKSQSLAPQFKTDLLPPPGALGPAR
jgi:hypothetical protein